MLSALWATAAAALGLLFIVGVNVVFWQNGVVLPLAGGVLMVAALYTMNMAYGYFVESRSKRQLAGRFGEYVPPELVDRMARDPGKYDMEPKDAELTDPVLRRARLHLDYRVAESGRAARVHQRVPNDDERHHPRPSPRHARQVHRRRDHGVLGRAGRGPAARAQRGARRARHAERVRAR